jgi:UDP-N-acetylmuramoyl-tripeptide--D-alanyl-D-alanine ligase
LYDYLALHGGTAIVDLSDPVLASMAGERKLKVFSYGMGGGFDVNGHLDAHDDRIEGSFDTGVDSSPLRSGLFGAYNFRNMLAAAAAGVFMKVPHRAITEAVERYVPQNNRSQTVRGKTNTLILDAYNANPTSMRNAITEFEQRVHPGKIAILGDMYELGTDEQKEHRALLEQLLKSNIKTVLLVGERFGAFAEDPAFPFHFFNKLEDCIAYLRKHPPENALIMLKGSRKNALENATKLLLDC